MHRSRPWFHVDQLKLTYISFGPFSINISQTICSSKTSSKNYYQFISESIFLFRNEVSGNITVTLRENPLHGAHHLSRALQLLAFLYFVAPIASKTASKTFFSSLTDKSMPTFTPVRKSTLLAVVVPLFVIQLFQLIKSGIP